MPSRDDDWIGFREPDPEIVRRLKEIEEGADVKWVPGPASRGPRWEVGCVFRPHPELVPHVEKRLEAARALPEAKRRPAYEAGLSHWLRGWRPIFHVTTELDGGVVEEYRKRVLAFELLTDAEVERRIDHNTLDNEPVDWRETVEQIVDEFHYSFFVKGRRSVHVNRGGRE